ncbi:LOC691083 [Phodopus roborovskii]|uniref:LOC691083 protein n=1 Tax=Phodopus roborovskii TaxID=109678 RepID=A0AAU9Z603_PHORO|nr:LOC691083 [Phodopus roborovskii]
MQNSVNIELSTGKRADIHPSLLLTVDMTSYFKFLPVVMDCNLELRINVFLSCFFVACIITTTETRLVKYCGLETSLLTSPLVGFMVTTQCKYHTPVGFPQIPVAALAVEKVGHSSVCYRLALFPPKSTKELPSVDHCELTEGFFLGHPKLAQFDTLACTTGSSVHVFVNPATRKPERLPEDFRNSLQKLMSPA